MTTFDKNFLLYIRLGVLGAITVSALFHFFVWIFSLGRDFFNFLLVFILTLPVPLIIGSLAGLLTWTMGGRLGSKFAYWFGIFTMAVSYYFSVYVSGYLYHFSQTDWQYRASAYAGPLIAGIFVEGILIILVMVWRISAKLLTRKG